MQPTIQVEATEPRSLWRHGDYLRFWTAGTISTFGDQFTALAIPLIAALMLDAKASQMGILVALNGAPFLLMSLFAGVWIDRWSRRPILIICDFGRAAVLLSIPLAGWLGVLRMGHLYVVELLVGTMNMIFQIAHQAYLPSLIDRRTLVDGNSRMAASNWVAKLAGPSAAGAFIEFFSAPFAVVLDAISYVLSGAFLYSIHQQESPSEQQRLPLSREIRVGFSTVFDNSMLRSLAVCLGQSNFFDAGFMALIVLFATKELNLGPAQLGFIFGLGSASGIVGAVTAGWFAARFGLGRVIVWGVLIYSAAMIPAAMAQPATAFSMLLATMLVSNLTGPVFSLNQLSLRQLITPHHLQGKMNATMRFLNTGPMTLGGLFGGVLGDTIGLRPAIIVLVVGQLCSFLWVYFSPVRTLREFPAPVD
jgi:MFS family permease